MSESAKTQIIDIEVPEYHIMVDESLGTINLVVTTSGSMYQSFLGMAKDYKSIAGKLREQIMRAGAELASKQSGLIVAKELPDGLRKPPQGRQ